MNAEVGQLVGYKVRFEEKLSEKTRIKFLTDGMFLREMQEDQQLRKYSVIVLDEIHERNLNQDFLLATLRILLGFNPLLKIVIMSATMMIDKFVDFFSIAEHGVSCKSVQVPG